MRFPYIARQPAVGPPGLAPLLPVRLGDTPPVDVEGLLDTGATVNVLPRSVGDALGLDWDSLPTPITLGGNLARVPARAVVLTARVGPYPSVRLAFAWADTDAVPVLLGQVNFFLEFDVCFYRSAAAFEVRPRGGL